MVMRAAGLICFLAPAFFLCPNLPAKSLASYKLGDTAEEDIVTPVPLEVVDAEATQALRERESRRGIIVFCFQPNLADEAEAAFRAAFLQTRSNFLNAVELVFHQRRLGAQELASTNFQELVSTFQKQNILCPVGTNLATLWAGGEADRDYESRLLAQLRQTMRWPVRSDYVPPGIRVGTTVRLLTVTNKETATVEMAAELGVNLHKTNLTSPPRSKLELQKRFPPADAAVAQHVATFIKPNCFINVDLTRGLRLKSLEALWRGDRYEAGQIIVKRGEVIDKKIKAALDQLHEKTAASRLNQAITDDQLKAAQARKRLWRLMAGLSAGFVMAVILVWKLAWRKATSLLPARIKDGYPEFPATEDASDTSWRRRALSAERRAEKANAVIRAGLISHLGRWLSDTLIQRLLLQRAGLLDAQQTAEQEMAELEARLEKIHAPLQDRLEAYEKRIAELEKDLAERGAENRVLIETKITLVRKQSELERAGGRLHRN